MLPYIRVPRSPIPDDPPQFEMENTENVRSVYTGSHRDSWRLRNVASDQDMECRTEALLRLHEQFFNQNSNNANDRQAHRRVPMHERPTSPTQLPGVRRSRLDIGVQLNTFRPQEYFARSDKLMLGPFEEMPTLDQLPNNETFFIFQRYKSSNNTGRSYYRKLCKIDTHSLVFQGMPHLFSVETQAYPELKKELQKKNVDMPKPPEDVLDRTTFMKEWKTDAYLEDSPKNQVKQNVDADADDQKEVILDRTTFLTEFETAAYLRDFYTKVDDPAMKMVLTFLPIIVNKLGNQKRVIDFGAGPTIHVAVCFRNSAEEIYLADYLPQNRDALGRWLDNTSDFDWTVALKMIDCREGGDWSKLREMQPLARSKVKDIYHCDCFADPSVECPKDLQGTFDVMVTIFCVEYCCNTYDEYKGALKNMAKQLRPGGFFIMGGILEETWCSFGGRKFSCLFITEQMMTDALNEAGLFIDNDKKCVMYEINGMFMVCARKH